MEYYCRGKKVHRQEPMRKLLLFEKQAQKSGDTSPRGSLGRDASFTSPSANTTGSGIPVSNSRGGMSTTNSRASGLPRLS